MTHFSQSEFRSSLAIAITLFAIACTETISPVFPNPPESVAVTLQGKSAIAVTWVARPAGENIVAYAVYRDGVRVGETATTTFVDTSPPENKTHSYAVASRSEDGIVSELSTPASIRAPDATPPRVLTTIPAANLTDVDPQLTLQFFFSEPLDPSSVTNASVDVRGPANSAIPGTTTYVPATSSIQWKSQSQVALDLPVTASVSAVKDTAANAMSPAFSFSFKTRGTTPPTVTAFIPANGSTNIAFTTTPIFVFSQPMAPFAFQVEALNGLPPVTVATTFDASRTRATARLSGVVFPSGTYRISIPETATDAFGNKIVDRPTYTFTFTNTFALPHISSTRPSDQQTDVELRPGLAAFTDQRIVLVGDYKATLDLRKADGTPVTVVPAIYSDFQGVISLPQSPTLEPNTRYIATATQTYTEPSGNVLRDVYTWSFTTGTH
ncbi:MAG TPA: Ig-like domain-containing protein [Gemmatimonadaceae bacterium]|nr:Ig-like domain-containing protein [Gemmatimonadaceae bacterium]